MEQQEKENEDHGEVQQEVIKIKVDVAHDLDDSEKEELNLFEKDFQHTLSLTALHCTCREYLSRPLMYLESESWILRARNQEGKLIGVWAIAAKEEWIYGERKRVGTGYLTRTVVSHRQLGLSSTFRMKAAKLLFSKDVCCVTAFIAETNKGSLRMSESHGDGIIGEHTSYCVPLYPLPNLKDRSNLEGLALKSYSPVEAEELYDRIYGKEDNLMLCDIKDVIFSRPQHIGVYTASYIHPKPKRKVRSELDPDDDDIVGPQDEEDDEESESRECNETSEAGVTVWDADYSMLVDEEGTRENRWALIYNIWTVGSRPRPVLKQLLKQTFSMLRDKGFRYVVCDVFSSESNIHVKAVVRKLAIGRCKEMIIGKSAFWGDLPFPPKLIRPFQDPRDFSTLLYFKPVKRKSNL